MIHIEHLSKKFGDLEVLKDINLDVNEGEVVVVWVTCYGYNIIC